jgi:molecular chaperone GrpE
MAADRKSKQSNRIPIRFLDDDDVSRAEGDDREDAMIDPTQQDPEVVLADEESEDEAGEQQHQTAHTSGPLDAGGPALAELVATRAELKRVQSELAESQDAVARRQADFDNYRKRIERERGEVQGRLVAEVARKLLPVVDNLARALEAERSLEAGESKEFRHFLHGVELISKQLDEVLESLGVQPINAVGKRFDPHIHEAVVTEPTEDYEPDTVMQEMARGYRIGDRLVRPAMVKVAAKADRDE